MIEVIIFSDIALNSIEFINPKLWSPDILNNIVNFANNTMISPELKGLFVTSTTYLSFKFTDALTKNKCLTDEIDDMANTAKPGFMIDLNSKIF